MKPNQVDPKSAFENINHSLSQYTKNFAESLESPTAIFDDILTVEERYQQTTVLNRGGMKKILKTIDSLTDRPVAKATLIDFEDSEKVENFLREARLTAALEHPNIIPVHDIGVDEVEGPFFTMKLVGGKNLAEIIKEQDSGSESRYSLRDLMVIFLKICDAVDYAHSRGVIHLDLKPENVQIDDYGEVLVCDWGLAKVLENPEDITEFALDLDPYLYNGMTLDGYIKGTPGYMAPEQVNSEIGPKNQLTDIFALGGILYSLLCYKVPFESSTVEGVLKETLTGDLLLPSERIKDMYVPSSLEAVAMKALEIKPENRYKTVSELREEINKWLGGFATEAENASFMTSFLLLLKRHKAVSALLMVFLVFIVFSFYQITKNERRAVANEKLALTNEKKANRTLKMYMAEKELTDQMSEHAINQLKAINQYHLENSEFEKALTFISENLKYQPENPLLNALKGEAHFYRQEYSEALECLQKSSEFKGQMPFKIMLELSPKYAGLMGGNDYIDAKKIHDFKDRFTKVYWERIWAFEKNKYSSLKKYQNALKSQEKSLSLKNHLELCRLLIISNRQQVTEESLNFKYNFEDDGIILDLSNSPGVEGASAIRHLPLKTLILENTKFWQTWIFNHYHLNSINIKNSAFRKIRTDLLRGSGIKNIICSQEQFGFSTLNETTIQFHGITIK